MYWAPGRRAWPAPHLQGVGRQVQRQVRRRLGRLSRAHVRAAEADWAGSPPTPSSRRAPTACRRGTSIPEAERPFQRRLMEVFAGFVEHADTQVGKRHRRARPAAESARTRWSSTSSATTAPAPRARTGTHQRAAGAERHPQHRRPAARGAGRARRPRRPRDAPKTDNMYHAGWAWAGNTPFQHTKLVARHFGGTRNPMAISWPKRIKPDEPHAPQFHHVNDIVADDLRDARHHAAASRRRASSRSRSTASAWPTPSTDADGADAQEDAVLREQRQPRHLPRRLVRLHLRPVRPVGSRPAPPGLATWDADKDVWELYDLRNDFSQANDLAQANPQKLAAR